MKPKISVIIPTFNRADVLERTIRAYLDQGGECRPFEVIVVDDGSTDATRQILERLMKNSGGGLRIQRQENKGPAAARNAGCRLAQGEIILFAGDDVIPNSDLLEQHLMTHRKHPGLFTAVLGHITWSSDQKITPFMSWLESGGFQFNYGAIRDPENVSAEQFYSSNLSLHGEFLIKGDLFDELFREACWEDIDLGMRLAKRGMRIVYNKDAVGHHVHPTDFRRYRNRMRRAGFYEGMYNRKHSRPAELPSKATMILKFLLGSVFRSCAFGTLRESGYQWSLQWYSWLGLRDYVRKEKDRP